MIGATAVQPFSADAQPNIRTEKFDRTRLFQDLKKKDHRHSSAHYKTGVSALTNLAASVERPVLAEGDHVVDALANGLGPHQRGRDAAVTDNLSSQGEARNG